MCLRSFCNFAPTVAEFPFLSVSRDRRPLSRCDFAFVACFCAVAQCVRSVGCVPDCSHYFTRREWIVKHGPRIPLSVPHGECHKPPSSLRQQRCKYPHLRPSKQRRFPDTVERDFEETQYFCTPLSLHSVLAVRRYFCLHSLRTQLKDFLVDYLLKSC